MNKDNKGKEMAVHGNHLAILVQRFPGRLGDGAVLRFSSALVRNPRDMIRKVEIERFSVTLAPEQQAQLQMLEQAKASAAGS